MITAVGTKKRGKKKMTIQPKHNDFAVIIVAGGASG